MVTLCRYICAVAILPDYRKAFTMAKIGEMSGPANATAQSLARLSMQMTETAVRTVCHDAGTAAAMAISGMAGPLFMAAGILSNAFATGEQGIHPANAATSDNVLFVALVMARAVTKMQDPDGSGKDGVALTLSPEVFMQAMDDFKKLSRTPLEQVIRPDLLAQCLEASASATTSVEALLARLQAPSADKLH